MTKQRKPKITAVTGATASGKTRLALSLAQKFNGEIISVDSRQIYKELNTGAAKPSKEELKKVKHHLIDIVSITDEYTAANFSDDAEKVIQDILSRGKLPVLAGGTGLYYRILLEDFDPPGVEPDKQLRAELEKEPSEKLHERLVSLDFELARKIHPNNKVKIIRALEVCINTGQPMSLAQKKKESSYDVLWLGLNCSDRNFLYDRINRRTDIMFENGLLKEAEELFLNFGADNNILMNTIGYKELLPYIKGDTDLESAKNLIKQNTRRYAKRQISWFKTNGKINNFDIKTLSFEKIEEAAGSLAAQFLNDL